MIITLAGVTPNVPAADQTFAVAVQARGDVARAQTELAKAFLLGERGRVRVTAHPATRHRATVLRDVDSVFCDSHLEPPFEVQYL